MDHVPILIATARWLGPHPGCRLSMVALDFGDNWSLGLPPSSFDMLVFPPEKRLDLSGFLVAPGWHRWQLEAMCEQRGAERIMRDTRATARNRILATMPNQ